MLTGFIHSVGVSSSFAFHDVLGLDEELLMMLPQPVQAMVLLFPSADAVRSGAACKDGCAGLHTCACRTCYRRYRSYRRPILKNPHNRNLWGNLYTNTE